MNKENKITYSGFWRRAAAYLLDCVFVFSMLLLSCFLMYSDIQISQIARLFIDPSSIIYTDSYKLLYNPNPFNIFISLLKLMILVLLPTLYYALQESSKYQATLGMRIMSIKIYTDSMQRISFWRSFGRVFAAGAALSQIIAPLSICSIVLWDKKQGLHDLACRTVVVFTPNEY